MNRLNRDKHGVKLEIKYDKRFDILYISFGDPRSGIAVEINEGDLIRLDPYSDEVVGITILDFKKKYMSSSSSAVSQSAQREADLSMKLEEARAFIVDLKTRIDLHIDGVHKA